MYYEIYTNEDWRQMPVTTGAELRAQIEEFCEQYVNADHSFAHIVLGDLNLDDEFIDWCLSAPVVDKWLEDQYQEHWNHQASLGVYRDGIVEYLQYLKTIPISIRNEASSSDD